MGGPARWNGCGINNDEGKRVVRNDAKTVGHGERDMKFASITLSLLIATTKLLHAIEDGPSQHQASVFLSASNHWLVGTVGEIRLQKADIMKRPPVLVANPLTNSIMAEFTPTHLLFGVSVISPKRDRDYDQATILSNVKTNTIIENDGDAIMVINRIPVGFDNVLEGTKRALAFGEMRQYKVATRETFRAIKRQVAYPILRNIEDQLKEQGIGPPQAGQGRNSVSASNEVGQCSLVVCPDNEKTWISIVFITKSYVQVERWSRYVFCLDKHGKMRIEHIESLGGSGGFM